MGVTGQADGIASATGTRGTEYWTRTSLVQYIVGSVPGARNASGGLVPDRLDILAKSKFGLLWECHPWNWRRVPVILTTAVGDEYIDLPSGYDYCDQLALTETSGNGKLQLTTNIQDFDDEQQGWTTNGVTDQDQPELAFCEVDPDATEYRRRLHIIPAADGVYAYRMYYFSLAPSLSATDVPKWPPFMFRLWETLVEALAEKMLRPTDDTWKGTYQFFRKLLDDAIEQNDRDLATQAPECHIGMDDWMALNGA
jgi:hypothetical protein